MLYNNQKMFNSVDFWLNILNYEVNILKYM
jgi:hypothetical protein